AVALAVRPGLVAAARGAGISLARFLREHVDTYRNPRSALPATVFIWHTFMYTAILAIVPVYADPADEALLLVAMPLISIAGTLAPGPLVRYASPALVLAIGFALVGAAILGLWAAVAANGPIVAAA